MEHARQFERKFERQLEVTAEYERKLREERTRLMHSEARYEKRIEDMTTKHAEEVTELTLRGVAQPERRQTKRTLFDSGDDGSGCVDVE